jgi:hypothetical protein
MSGIKYSQAVLSEARRVHIACTERVRQCQAIEQRLAGELAGFKKKHQKSMTQTTDKLNAIVAKISALRPHDVTANYSTYDHHLQTAIAQNQAVIGGLNASQTEINQIEKDLLLLEYMLDEEKTWQGQRDQQKAVIETEKKAAQSGSVSGSYFEKHLHEYLGLLTAWQAQMAALQVNFDEDPDVLRNHLDRCIHELQGLVEEVKSVIEGGTEKLRAAKDVEAADSQLRLQIREKMRAKLAVAASREAAVSKAETEVPWQRTLLMLKAHPAQELFSEIKQHLSGIGQFLEILPTQPQYATDKILELLRYAESYAAKYNKLLNRTHELHADVAVSFAYFQDLRTALTIDQKTKLDDLEGDVAKFLKTKIIHEDDYQKIIRRILGLREEFDRSIQMARENEFMAMAITATLKAEGYDLITEIRSEGEYAEAPLIFEIKLTARLRVKFSLAPTGDFVAQVVYKSIETDLSKNEWNDIQYEINKWEAGYDKMRETLKREGIFIKVPDFKSFDEDRIVIEYATDSEDADRKNLAKPAQQAKGNP